MNAISAVFTTLFYNPILNLLVGFYKLFLMAKIPGAFGFSIVALTVFIRLILHPFFKQQLQTAKKMQEIKPHLDKVQEKHKKDPKKLQEEQMRIYKEAGINPASGCLFMILQMPILIALYQGLITFLGAQTNPKTQLLRGIEFAAINKALYFPFLKISQIDPWFFGVNLIVTPATAGNYLYYLIPVITAVLQYFQYQTSMPPAPAVDEKAIEVKKEGKQDDMADFQKAMNTQMKFIFPLMIGWFSLRMPVGLSLYWNIFSLFSIMQYKMVHSKKS